MIKALSAMAIAAFIAAALTVLPGFAPEVEAGVSAPPLAKSDRLDVRQIGRECSQQAWPNFEASCLRKAGSKAVVREARIVSADGVPLNSRVQGAPTAFRHQRFASARHKAD